MAGRPAFKCRKIVIEPAVVNFWSISKVVNAASMKMKNILLARREYNGSYAEPQRARSKLILVFCTRISNLLKEFSN
ncbi:MAG: hypothetical protein GY775_11335 [Candidatus Scalindua sp.]|nr:hypothetical protein [Candidatus Scalindua sp.]